jgi:hypothetical protein
VKAICWLRWGVMEREEMMASYSPACSPGMIASQFWVTMSQRVFIAVQRARAISTSKPATCPSLSMKLKGGLAPSVAMRMAAGARAVARYQP